MAMWGIVATAFLDKEEGLHFRYYLVMNSTTLPESYN